MMMRWCKYALPHTAVRRDANRRSSKGETSLFLRSSIFNPCCWLKKTMFVQGATRWKDTCSTCIRMEEDDVDEQEADLAKDKANKVRLTKTTPNFGRKTEAIEEPSKEGGASILV